MRQGILDFVINNLTLNGYDVEFDLNPDINAHMCVFNIFIYKRGNVARLNRLYGRFESDHYHIGNEKVTLSTCMPAPIYYYNEDGTENLKAFMRDTIFGLGARALAPQSSLIRRAIPYQDIKGYDSRPITEMLLKALKSSNPDATKMFATEISIAEAFLADTQSS